jgi:hypothetical protein
VEQSEMKALLTYVFSTQGVAWFFALITILNWVMLEIA